MEEGLLIVEIDIRSYVPQVNWRMFKEDGLKEALSIKSINQEVAIVISLRSSRKGKELTEIPVTNHYQKECNKDATQLPKSSKIKDYDSLMRGR